jgi:hypothetical protein
MIQNINTMDDGDGTQNKLLFPIASRIISLLTQIVPLPGVDLDNNEMKVAISNGKPLWGVAKYYYYVFPAINYLNN